MNHPKVSPSTENYTLGKGILSVGLWSGSTPPAVFTDLGNAPSFNIEITREKLDHYSSRSGVRSKDKTLEIESGYKIAFELDEMSVLNLKTFLRGTLTGTNKIHANTNIGQEFAVKFVSGNTYGQNFTWEFWKCELSPNGALNLISDEVIKMGFNGEGLEDSVNHSSSKFFDVTFVTTTTTTTTTSTAA